MGKRADEIAERIYYISSCMPEMAPGGFTFNQFLVDADEPLLYRTGMRAVPVIINPDGSSSRV